MNKGSMKTSDSTFNSRNLFRAFVWGCTFACAVPAVAQQWTSSGPTARYSHSATFARSNAKMTIFGGFQSEVNGGAENLNDVWLLSDNGGTNLSWTKPAVSGARPSPRSGHTAVYDSNSNRMVVFGGGLGFASPCTNDTWALQNADGVGALSWTQLNPTGSLPAARLRHTAVYDESSNIMIIYGGNDCFSARFGDVWILTDANGVGGTPAWSQLSPAGLAPAGRENASAVYDPTSNRMIVYGGDEGVPTADNSVWVLTNANGSGGTPTWIQLSVAGTPPPVREGQSAVYDAQNNIMTIFGGQSEVEGGGLFNDVWVLTDANGIGSPSWRQLEPTLTVGPEPRLFHTAVYNPANNKMTVFGGIGTALGTTVTNADLQDVWILSNANGQ